MYKSLVVLVVLVAAGCFRSSAPRPSHQDTEGPHGPACAAIEAASSLDSPSERTTSLGTIARGDLNEHEQLYLVEVTLDSGGFSGDVADVLIALLEHSDVRPNARLAISSSINKIAHPPDRKRVIDALSKKESAKSSTEDEAAKQ